MGEKPLTIEELRQMAGQPVRCQDEEADGVIMCDKIGQWAGIPFLHGVWYESNNGYRKMSNQRNRKQPSTPRKNTGSVRTKGHGYKGGRAWQQ